jgi:phosphatidylinositol alpha 1,6-mannosyltransferase
MDNAVPIAFLHDPEHPELTYAIGFSLSPAIKQQMDGYEPSIIHLCATDCTSLHVIQYARTKEIPIMGTYHSNIPDYMDHYPGLSWLKHILRGFFRHQYNFLQALYVPTPYIQQNLINDSALDRVTSLQIWGRGVDTEKFNPANRSMEYRRHILGEADDTTPILLWVGRLVSEKRPDIFINIVRRLYERKCKFHALVVGAGICEDEIKALPNTTFTGWMTADQLSTVYASSDVFLFPSAVETFGNVTLEAAASGLPVVVEAGCSGHLVHHDGNGFVCPADDEDAFYEATVTLIEDKQLREEFGVCSREIALSLEKSTVVRQMLDNYSRITDQFYTKYSGHHTKRDIEYTQPGSFILGVYPRPIILIIFESLFVFLFDTLWKLTSFMIWFNSKCIGHGTSHSITASSNATVTVDNATLNTIAQEINKSPSNRNIMPSSLKTNPRQKEIQAQIDSKTRGKSNNHKQSVIELNDVEIGDNNIREPLLNADDHTSSTSNSSQNTTTSFTLVKSKKVVDVGIAHTLTKAFVTSVQFQCRLESRIRQYFSSQSNKKRIEFIGAAKRKNSSMAVLPLNDLGDTSHDTCIRGRNEIIICEEDIYDIVPPKPDDGISGSPKSVNSMTLQDSRHMMRRNQNLQQQQPTTFILQ